MNRREIYYVALILILLFTIFFFKFLIHPNELLTASGDLKRLSAEWSGVIRSSFFSFNIPLWNHYVQTGIIYLGHPLNMMVFPSTLLFLMFSINSLIYVFMIEFLIAGLFIYLFARNIGINKAGAIITTISFMISETFITWLIVPSFINSIFLFPALMYLTEKLMQNRTWIYSLYLSIVMGLQLIGAGPQLPMYSLFLASIYLVLRIIFEKLTLKVGSRLIAIFLAGIVLGVLVSAVQMLPAMELSQYSTRSAGLEYEEATVHSFPFQNLITLVLPNFFGTNENYWAYWPKASFGELAVYVGLIALMFAMVAMFSKKNKYGWIMIILALFSLSFCFGKNFVVFPIIYKIVPFMDLVRVPARMLILFSFFMAVLAGIGYANFISSDKVKKLIVKLLSIFLILAILGTVGFIVVKDKIIDIGESKVDVIYKEYSDSGKVKELSKEDATKKISWIYNFILDKLIIFNVFILVILLILLCYVKNKIGIGVLAACLIIVATCDLFYASNGLISGGEPTNTNNKIVTYIANDNSTFRVMSLRDYVKHDYFPHQLALNYNVDSVGGCSGISLKYYYEYICLIAGCEAVPTPCVIMGDINYPKLVNLLNAKYIVDSEERNYTLLVKDSINNQTVYLYDNKDYLPRVFLVPNAKVIKSDEERFNELKSDGFDPKKYVILEKEINHPLTNEGNFQAADILKYSNNEIVVKIKNDNPGFLLFSENWYPGWNAYVDGSKTDVYKTDHTFRSIYLEAGDHMINMKYEPNSVKIGAIISGITILLIFSMLIYLYIKRK